MYGCTIIKLYFLSFYAIITASVERSKNMGTDKSENVPRFVTYIKQFDYGIYTI